MKKLFPYISILIIIGLGIFGAFYLKKINHVSLEDGVFKLKNKKFYPKVLNYKVSTLANNNEVWPNPYVGYYTDQSFKFSNKDSSLLYLKSDFQLIKELGYNCIRAVGICEYNFDESKNGALSVKPINGNHSDTTLFLNRDKDRNLYFGAIRTLLDVAEEEDLKIILLLRMLPDYNSTDQMLAELIKEFGDHPSIFAYDLFNEPLYQDLTHRSKISVYHQMYVWDSIVRANTDYQLTTIGLEGVRDVFEWDPNAMIVDFISYHPYEYELDQVRNELYWYGKYTKKPWIVGETAIPADNDSVPYSEQVLFAAKTFEQAYNCGAIGYSWWQYKDVNWKKFHADFMGVVTREGKTITSKDGYVVNGTVKPVSKVIKDFDVNKKKSDCLCLDNYYNYSLCDSLSISGKIVDQNDKPIEGAIVLAWDEFWVRSYHTISNKKGEFELFSYFPFFHWSITATEHNTVFGNIDASSYRLNNKNIETQDIGTITIEKLFENNKIIMP